MPDHEPAPVQEGDSSPQEPGLADKPSVSVIVPCFKEEETITLLLTALLNQSYPTEHLEVVIVDAMSPDGTRQRIQDFCQAHPELKVRVLDNARRTIPAALNVALEAAQGEYIVRLDAHSVPSVDYVERCVQNLQAGKGDNVGGVWEIRPSNPSYMARAISVAAAHPLGVGDARYRYTTQAGEVDTVPFGSFRRSLIERVGKFDESLLANEDYEFNARIRQSGGRIWLDPAIRTVYFSRPGLRPLAQQYFRYGFWKWLMLRDYPQTLRWRQALPPLFVLSLAFFLVMGLFLPPAFLVFGLELIFYGLAVGAGSMHAAVKRGTPGLAPGIGLAIATMHLCWGCGFLWSAVKTRLKGKPKA